MIIAQMWEARAAEGRGGELLAWVREQPVVGEPLRYEILSAEGGRVLAITWWEVPTEAEALPELPAPPPELLGRPVHRWRFTSREVR
ncbi:hypothetical protein [Streptomyces zingiberis]|uniref:ABM domain-containing protein n=1 Tax=Streptomyces zingiberis TaxID=2053010 RepID=A0ABX1C532_9ACTN|nr:hypothetical protein [Streptomyces zingiberis]NJQ03265.1 hypothetical protein [Streptomyces zingiberis]